MVRLRIAMRLGAGREHQKQTVMEKRRIVMLKGE
jgi:hypothetical protein